MTDFLDSFNEDRKARREAMRERYKAAREVVKDEARRNRLDDPRTQEEKARVVVDLALKKAQEDLAAIVEEKAREQESRDKDFPSVKSAPVPEDEMDRREKPSLEKKRHVMEMGMEGEAGSVGLQENRETPDDSAPPIDTTHPFKGTVKNNTTITIAYGVVFGMAEISGTDHFLLNTTSCTESDVTDSGTGGIWLSAGGQFNTFLGGIENYDEQWAADGNFAYDTTSTPNEFSSGNTAVVPILTFATDVSGNLSITNQIVKENVYIGANRMGLVTHPA